MRNFLDTAEQKLCAAGARVDRRLLAAVSLAALACMLLAHGFAFANLFPNHDGTVLVFDAQWTMYVLGRWAQNLYFPLIRGKIAAPWLIGAFGTLYLALAGYGIARLLELKRWAAALLTGLLGCCASVTSVLATYTYETDAYLLAMLLACAGVWCAERWRGVWGVCGAAGFLAGMAGPRRVRAGLSGGRRGALSAFGQGLAGAHRLPAGGHRQRSGPADPAGAGRDPGGDPGGVSKLFCHTAGAVWLE